MSGSKASMDSLDQLRAKARCVLRAACVLEFCEYHGVYFDTWVEIEGAYRLGNTLVTRGRINLDGWSRRSFTDAMKHELEEHTTLGGCPCCEHAMAA